MPRLQPDLKRRTVTLETKRRSVDIPVDGAGHIRRVLAQPPQLRAATSIDDVRAAVDAGESVPFGGKFIPLGQRQWIGSKRWGWWEENMPGCVTKTMREKRAVNNDITFNRDHDNRILFARTSNGTLRLSEDPAYGLAEADMGPYSYTLDLAIALHRGDLTGMSYAFDVINYEWDIAEDGNDLLRIHEMELFDVAVVGMPANVDTDAGLRLDIMAVARSAGFDVASFDALARRLAEPDPDLIAALRALSRDEQPPAPVRSTQDPDHESTAAPARTTQPDDERSTPPAQTTAPTINPLAVRTLEQRTSQIKEI